MLFQGFLLVFEIRKNLDLRKILYTPKIFLKSRFYCSASCAHTTSTPNQKFIYNQDFSAMLDRIPGICCFYAPNWMEGLPKATQVRSLVPTKSLSTIKTFMLCQIEFQNFDVPRHVIGREGYTRRNKCAYLSTKSLFTI